MPNKRHRENKSSKPINTLRRKKVYFRILKEAVGIATIRFKGILLSVCGLQDKEHERRTDDCCVCVCVRVCKLSGIVNEAYLFQIDLCSSEIKGGLPQAGVIYESLSFLF
jgi:hypothetical protein